MAKETVLYCQLINGRNGPKYMHFYQHPKVTMMCGEEPVVKVLVREIPQQTPDCYWAWWDNKDAEFHHVYPVRQLVEICFAYGSKGEEERGKGVVLPVEVITEEIGEVC